MHYPSYNALLLFSHLHVFSLDYIRFINISACNLLPSLHETDFSENGYSSSPVCSRELFYFIELLPMRTGASLTETWGAIYSTWECISWRGFSTELQEPCTVGESDSLLPWAPWWLQLGTWMADRTYTIWMQTRHWQRSITLAVSNHIWMFQITKSITISCMSCAPPHAY